MNANVDDSMAEGPSTQIPSASAASQNGVSYAEAPRAQKNDGTLTLIFALIGVAVTAAFLAFAIVRFIVGRRPPDPTTERIQQLIDEANRLLKALDEKHPA